MKKPLVKRGEDPPVDASRVCPEAVRKCRAGEKARWVRRAGPAEDTRGEGERDCAQGGQRVRPPLGDRGLRQKGSRQGGWEGL